MSARRQALFEPEFIEDLTYWVGTDRRVALRILALIQECLRTPCNGTGKPEALRHWRGAWSRRIDLANRLVYVVEDARVTFLQCRYHYGR